LKTIIKIKAKRDYSELQLVLQVGLLLVLDQH
jgi:hypothetical protein